MIRASTAPRTMRPQPTKQASDSSANLNLLTGFVEASDSERLALGTPARILTNRGSEWGQSPVPRLTGPPTPWRYRAMSSHLQRSLISTTLLAFVFGVSGAVAAPHGHAAKP